MATTSHIAATTVYAEAEASHKETVVTGMAAVTFLIRPFSLYANPRKNGTAIFNNYETAAMSAIIKCYH